jgi:hypothetical protein
MNTIANRLSRGIVRHIHSLRRSWVFLVFLRARFLTFSLVFHPVLFEIGRQIRAEFGAVAYKFFAAYLDDGRLVGGHEVYPASASCFSAMAARWLSMVL